MVEQVEDTEGSGFAPERLKRAALRLFSARGIDAVPVREIVTASGERNNASLHYYFGSKEGLVRELIIECAELSEGRRLERLERLEAEGGPKEPADIVRLLVEVEATPRIEGDSGAFGHGSGHMRFVMALQITNRQRLQAALEGRANPGYERCVEHLHRLLSGIPRPLLNQRLIFMDLFLGASLAARETAFEGGGDGGKLWRSPDALDNLVDSACGALVT